MNHARRLVYSLGSEFAVKIPGSSLKNEPNWTPDQKGDSQAFVAIGGGVQWAKILMMPPSITAPRPLENTVIAVTSAGRGFGHSIARAMSVAGATVICVDANPEAASLTAAELERGGAQSIPIKGDSSVQLEVAQTFNKMLEIYGSINGLVHIADEASSTPFKKLLEGEFTEMLETTARSSYLMLQMLLKRCPNAWATLVLPPQASNEPQTRALRSYLSGLVGGLSETGMRVNALVPSRAAGGLEFDSRLGESAVSLALTASRGITGQTIGVTLSALKDVRSNIPREFYL